MSVWHLYVYNEAFNAIGIGKTLLNLKMTIMSQSP